MKMQLDTLYGTADRLQPNDKMRLMCIRQQMICLQLDILDGTAGKLQPGDKMPLICKTVDMHKTVDDLPAA